MSLAQTIKSNKYYILIFLLWSIVAGFCYFLSPANQLFVFFNQGFVSTPADYFFYVCSGFGRGEFTAFALIGLLVFKKNRNLRYCALAAGTGLTLSLVANGLKSYYNCPRPAFVFGPENIHIPDLVGVLYNHSFPSGHTTAAFALSTLLAFLFYKKYKVWSSLFIIPAILTALSRMYLGAHFFKDVYFGSLLGFAISFIIFAVINRFIPENEK